MKRWLTLAFVLISSAASALPVMQAQVISQNRTIPLTLEVASTPATRGEGLMKRKTLAPLDGMAFAWPQPQDASFWMKNTMIPLDILFLDSGGVVRHIAANTTPYSLEPIMAGGLYLTAIEIDGGRAAKEGIAVGQKVRFELPKELRVE